MLRTSAGRCGRTFRGMNSSSSVRHGRSGTLRAPSSYSTARRLGESGSSATSGWSARCRRARTIAWCTRPPRPVHVVTTSASSPRIAGSGTAWDLSPIPAAEGRLRATSRQGADDARAGSSAESPPAPRPRRPSRLVPRSRPGAHAATAGHRGHGEDRRGGFVTKLAPMRDTCVTRFVLRSLSWQRRRRLRGERRSCSTN
jgi:hypothetical protein